MGATPSTVKGSRGHTMFITTKTNNTTALHKGEEEIVKLMMPVYYNENPITSTEKELAENCWKMILNDTSPEFISKKKNPNFPHPVCIVYFYNAFYARLFDIHPLARNLFKDVRSQGKFLVKMISLSMTEDADPAKYSSTLVQLAEVHNERGVKAVEYGLVGEVLFWSIRQCTGPSVYTYDVHQAWVKIYSRMLRIMVPVAVAHELRDGSAQEKRFLGETIGISSEEGQALHNITASQPTAGSDSARGNGLSTRTETTA